MEERREMNGQRMMTREELEMRLPALNHIAEQRDAKFGLRYAEKTVNNGIERGYTLDAGTRVSVNVYQNESWAQMSGRGAFRYPERSRWKILCDGRPGDDRGETECPF